ncbi:MAG: phosphoadenylyl-sulfate reductase [Candidatus Omnitrophica bacterium]|nr:phosphoadenylyl-sulfate reductase [Candidatus Omnitrophota bacterium]
MSVVMTKKLNLEKLNAQFEKSQPAEILRWAIDEFKPKVALSSSFQTESVVLLHMVSKIDPSIKVLFLETGWHFQETLEFKKEVVKRFGLTNVVELKADPKKREALGQETGGKPYEMNPDQCCYMNKVEPLQEALKGLEAWISGIRRSQSKTRKEIKIVEEYQGGLFKINPLANVTSGDIWWYIKEHKLPQHPLFEQGYLSIGCWPCTKPAQPGDDERSGRWAGKEKTECGIHTFMKPKRAAKKEMETQAEKQEGSEI